MGLKALLGAAGAVALVFPGTTAMAQSTWLVLRYGVGGDGALEKIEMQDMTQCQIQGAAYESSKTLSEKGYGGHVCLEGK